MALPISVTYTFATATSAIPLSQLDANFTTVVNGINGIGNGTNSLSNVSITGGNVAVTTANATTINATTLNAATLRSDTSLTFQSNGTTTAMTINTSQNVGIGTASPGYKLDVNGGVSNTYMRVTGDSSDAFYGMDTVGVYCGTTSATKPIRFLTNSSETMRIDSSGNVGIGTSSPGYKMSVNGDVYTQTTNGNVSLTQGATTNSGYVAFWNADRSVRSGYIGYATLAGSGTFVVSSDISTNAMIFQTNGAERARIDASGNLLVGGTSVISGSTFYSSSASGTCSSRCTTTTAGHYYTFGHDGNDNFRVLNAAAAGVYLTYGGTTWTSLSDERHKDIIEPITDAITKVNSLRSVIGKYKTDQDGTRRVFLIAQDVKAVLPEAVDAKNEESLGLSYTDVVPLLVAAIKELKAEVDALKGTA